MEANTSPAYPIWFQKLPKVELHRHLEGAVRLKTLLEITNQYKELLPSSANLPALVQVMEGDETSFTNFLSKFQVLRYFYHTPAIIKRVAYEAVEDAAQDGLEYMELRFSPVALSRMRGFALSEVMDWVIESVRQASQQFNIQVNLIATINRHEGLLQAEQIAQLAIERRSQGIVALDLAGNESDFSALPFANILHEARKFGLFTTIHAGEWGPAKNVREAIEELYADRIGHGVRVMEDPDVISLARERQIVFEVCVTSNYQSGVVSSIPQHPLVKMLDAGLNVTINTDDPSISRITLSQEYHLTCKLLGITPSILVQRILSAAKAAFLPETERQTLANALQKKLDLFLNPQ